MSTLKVPCFSVFILASGCFKGHTVLLCPLKQPLLLDYCGAFFLTHNAGFLDVYRLDMLFCTLIIEYKIYNDVFLSQLGIYSF